jgi:parallel beta-helix repeat protein
MAVTTRYLAAGLSDAGRRRDHNEDRFYCDADRGIFFVIDGVGGHAAGETAAETALSMLKARLERQTGSVADRIREGITLANNEIFRLAQTNVLWQGMACVLTVAVVEDGRVTVGHVGDSRLYLIRGRQIEKLTHDHSPVGEREDSGEIGEEEAMRHPRRNEVYRDAGSEEHAPDDPDFIELVEAPLPPDGALLLCSDGLSDLVPSSRILELVREHAGRPRDAAEALVAAANAAGGKDNVTVIVVEGDQFAASPVNAAEPVRASGGVLLSRWAFLVYGLLAAVALMAAVKPHWMWSPEGTAFGFGEVRLPQTWRVGPADSIGAALKRAKFGDTVVVEPGTYREQVQLQDGVSLVSERPREAVLQGAEVVVTAEGVRRGRIAGFRIGSDTDTGMTVGLQITDSDLDVSDLEITGATIAGVEIKGSSTASLIGNRIHDNSGTGMWIGDAARPRLAHNIVAGNGRGAKKPGIEISGTAKPVLSGNTIVNNTAEGVWTSAPMDAQQLMKDNFFDPKRQIRTVQQ